MGQYQLNKGNEPERNMIKYWNNSCYFVDNSEYSYQEKKDSSCDHHDCVYLLPNADSCHYSQKNKNEIIVDFPKCRCNEFEIRFSVTFNKSSKNCFYSTNNHAFSFFDNFSIKKFNSDHFRYSCNGRRCQYYEAIVVSIKSTIHTVLIKDIG